MGVLIDASILIEYERRNLSLETRLKDRQDEIFFVSVVTASELLHGVYRAADSGIRARRSAWVEAVLTRFPLLPVDLAVARLHAQLWAQLVGEGRIIGPHDLWLAATCLTFGLALVTANVREFERVQGLTLECWNPERS